MKNKNKSRKWVSIPDVDIELWEKWKNTIAREDTISAAFSKLLKRELVRMQLVRREWYDKDKAKGE